MGWSGLLGLASLLLLLATTVAGPAGEASNAYAADKGNWKNVTVLYLNDVKGQIDPCG